MKRLLRFIFRGGKWKALPFRGEQVQNNDFILYVSDAEGIKVITDLNRSYNNEEAKCRDKDSAERGKSLS